jgi:hypothetical protein
LESGRGGELAGVGSKRHLQLYVNLYTEVLNARIRESFSDLSSVSLDWRSPLANDGYREYWDGTFSRRSIRASTPAPSRGSGHAVVLIGMGLRSSCGARMRRAFFWSRPKRTSASYSPAHRSPRQ